MEFAGHVQPVLHALPARLRQVYKQFILKFRLVISFGELQGKNFDHGRVGRV
jgi:hypothetical protein